MPWSHATRRGRSGYEHLGRRERVQLRSPVRRLPARRAHAREAGHEAVGAGIRAAVGGTASKPASTRSAASYRRRAALTEIARISWAALAGCPVLVLAARFLVSPFSAPSPGIALLLAGRVGVILACLPRRPGAPTGQHLGPETDQLQERVDPGDQQQHHDDVNPPHLDHPLHFSGVRATQGV